MSSLATMLSTETGPEAEPLLSARDLTKVFHTGGQDFRAVDGVSLDVKPGKVLGIVGESGSGKSTVARMVMRLIEPSSGQIMFEGENLTAKSGEALRQTRRHMQIVFQNPHSALNPRDTIGSAIAEPFLVQTRIRGAELERRVEALLDIISLPKAFKYRYPHELSGGQKQRVCIARAVALEPRLLVLDEPTSALDVSVQAQILMFLQDLRVRLNLTYLFISHNLAVVRHLCDDVIVMSKGRIVESGSTDAVFKSPREAYTRKLIDSVPRIPRLCV
ncbi:ATP-binding cassette domain-containing protein [Microvirga zambiensis]|uniref:ATP-binding cassette domain-containing protein n=1 Tax=Microvirga zambiensis TaxID=1402137 RepID=UPI00191DE628|nr:ATP-binding cassette domain-containing protein [Microvirga zambiensis]